MICTSVFPPFFSLKLAGNEAHEAHGFAARRAATDSASTGERATSTIHRVVEEISSGRWIISDQWENTGRHQGVGHFGLVPHQPGATAVLRNHSASHDPQRPRVSRGRCAPHTHHRADTARRLCTCAHAVHCAHRPRSAAPPRTHARAVREIIDTLTLAMRQHGCEDVVCVVNMSEARGASPFVLPCVAGFVVSHRCRRRLKRAERRRGWPQPIHTRDCWLRGQPRPSHARGSCGTSARSLTTAPY